MDREKKEFAARMFFGRSDPIRKSVREAGPYWKRIFRGRQGDPELRKDEKYEQSISKKYCFSVVDDRIAVDDSGPFIRPVDFVALRKTAHEIFRRRSGDDEANPGASRDYG